MDEQTVYKAALAGLLHDIGKFAQRAGWRSGSHTEVGGEFVSRYVPEIWRGHLYPVMGHHDKPLQGYETKIVALADRLSAGERKKESEAQPKRLLSIFCDLDEGTSDDLYWPIKPLTLDGDKIFPAAGAGGDTPQKYADLWALFEHDVKALNAEARTTEDLPTYLESMRLLLQRYTWCVPSAYYRSRPDVSLYDHSRTTAALAACLTGLDESFVDDLLAHQRQDAPLVLLVGGDVSGVQDFIYTITAKGAAKGLRGRSFYLQLLTEAIARFVLRELGLPLVNLIYAGGGHFYILAPLDKESDLEKVRASVSRKLLTHHGGDLYLAMGWTTVSAREFSITRFGEKWQEVSQVVNTAKRHRFAELEDADSLIEQVFGPIGSGGEEQGECQVCHFDGPVTTEHKGDPDRERRICALCKSFEELGTDLREADYLLLGEIEPQTTERHSYVEALAAFGMAIGFTDRNGRPIRRLQGEVRRAALLAMRDMDDVIGTAHAITRRRGYPVAPGIRYTVNVTPRVSEEDTMTDAFKRYIKGLKETEIPKPGDVKEFGLMQEQSQGVKRLGVLRMDVDDLGHLFAYGIKDATLSRISALSFAFSLFFEGWVSELCRRVNAAGHDKVYAIYSGGDDLFIVGAWDVLPELAHNIRLDLARFAAHNPAVHISGGLTLHAGKYPLYQAAADAENALDAAKDLERDGGHSKDGFGFLGQVIPWEDFPAIVQERDELLKMVKPRNGGVGVNRALLRTLIRLYTLYRKSVQEHGKPYWGPLMWRSVYFLRRMEMRAKSEDQRESIKRVRESIGVNTFAYLETLGIAARWVELLTRKEGT